MSRTCAVRTRAKMKCPFVGHVACAPHKASSRGSGPSRTVFVADLCLAFCTPAASPLEQSERLTRSVYKNKTKSNHWSRWQAGGRAGGRARKRAGGGVGVASGQAALILLLLILLIPLLLLRLVLLVIILRLLLRPFMRIEVRCVRVELQDAFRIERDDSRRPGVRASWRARVPSPLLAPSKTPPRAPSPSCRLYFGSSWTLGRQYFDRSSTVFRL